MYHNVLKRTPTTNIMMPSSLTFSIPPLTNNPNQEKKQQQQQQSASITATAAAAADDDDDDDNDSNPDTNDSRSQSKRRRRLDDDSSLKRTTSPVVVGHLTHAHEAALNCRHTCDDTQYDRFHQQHETERLASYIHPNGPKASNVIPALVGDWACATLQAPKPRDPIQRGERGQSPPPIGEYTKDWEDRGVIFWHLETVGNTLKDAAHVMWKMEDLEVGPICNKATDITKDYIRFLGRYTINDYGLDLPTNKSLEDEDPNKATVEFSDESTTHFDILLGDEDQIPSLGSVCYFSSVEEYWDHFADLSSRRDFMNNEEEEDNDEDDETSYEPTTSIDDVSFPDGIHILPNRHGVVAVARKHDWMFLRAILDDDDNDKVASKGGARKAAVKAFVFYYSVGSDDFSFSEWRVFDGTTASPIIPGNKGLPPGGVLDRNDQIDSLYGCRPFEEYSNSNIKRFFDSMADEDLVEWWTITLPSPIRYRFVRRLILGGYWDLWQRLEQAIVAAETNKAGDDSSKSLSSIIGNDESWIEVASNVPELNSNVLRNVMFEEAPPVPIEIRQTMKGHIAQLVASEK